MEDSDNDDAKLKEEIEAELDKISISSLEQDEVESESNSETLSEGSDADLEELPESVLHCINIIKNKSKTVEELLLQDLEDTNVLSYSYGTVSDNHMHLRIGLSTEYKENQEQLMKILTEIEKEEFMRSKSHCENPDLVPEPDLCELSMDEHALPDDADINFGYFEVEERCRQSFEAWQDKQKELEDKDKEILKAQRDKEEKQFQEEEEKRHCWMKQFEVEKKKLENIQKQEQDKMNEELHEEEKMWKEKFKQHEEFMRNLHVQMEEERTRFKELQKKEKMRLLELQHNAAVKIQAKYKAFIIYQKYSPIIRDRIERKQRKAKELKEKEANIRQKEEENRKKLEEEQRIEEEIKKQKQEERKRREKVYEEKKNILRREREELQNKEKFKLIEAASQQLIISTTLKKGEHNAKHITIEDKSKNKGEIAKELVYENSKKQENVPLWVVKKLNKSENIGSQFVLKEPIQEQLKSNQAILAELKIEETNESLAKKQCSQKMIKQEIKYEDMYKRTELEILDLKENMIEQFQQELKTQTQNQERVEYAIKENEGGKIQIVVLECNEEMNDVKSNEAQKIIEFNEQKMIQKVEKEEISQGNGLYEENTSIISINQKLLPLKLENAETMEEYPILQEKEINLKSKEAEENSKGNTLNSDIMFFNITDAMVNREGKINKQDYFLDRLALHEDFSGCNKKISWIANKENSFISEINEIPEECYENRAECEQITTSTLESTLLSSIEEKRLAWLKSFKPWFEIFSQNQQKKIVKRKRPLKCLANTMPPLSTLEILQYGHWNTLQQVTTITFQDLPGCSLSTLAECTNLQFLSLRCCGLTSLHGLNNCKKLKYIDVQENYIETINCENLENLCVVLLNKNQLSSFHGLDGCTNIQNLELSHNKITRIGGLESLKNLQQLIVDHNQLISTKGLCETPTIIYLDCSYNHLTDVEGLENCGLLQILKLQGNNLTELPSLENHVLLRELHLDDNSISTVEGFSSYWLPLLQNLTISQNRHSLLEVLPSLKILNGDTVNSHSEIHTQEHCHLESRHLLAFCQSQIREFNLLSEKYVNGNRDVFTLDTAENFCYYFKKLMTLSSECRYAHEHGDISITKRDESETQKNHLAIPSSDFILQDEVFHSSTNKHRTDSPGISEQWMDPCFNNSPISYSSAYEVVEGRSQEKLAGLKKEDGKTKSIPTKGSSFMETEMTNSLLRNHQHMEQSEKIRAAVVIQAHWRGYLVRTQINFSTRRHTAAVEPLPNSFINIQTILKKEKRKNTMNNQEQREKAAVLIQAVWKGFILRKKLTTALKAIKNEESEEEYEEIDLEDFTFDEISGTLKYDDASLNLPSHPAQAWLCNDKENCFSSEHTHLNGRSENGTLSWTSESKTSRKSLLRSEKEEKISEEWGFKDISTAQQMLKRAQKMKSKKLKKKLDPSVRLALFKNNENKVSVINSPKQTPSKRDGYFEGKEEDFIYKDTTANEKLERSKEYTYQWLHTQVGVHAASSRNMKCNHFLPELDPDVLNGGRVQLVARLVSREDTDLDLFSMTSGSALSVNREKKNQAHRYSAGSSSCSIKGIVAPIITNSRPSKKERISFRDNPVRLSGGWGSGRKKEKTSN
uniref:leucine-rich repeat and IQ domain-containing protein 1 isoform X3 n=1 Tax=Ictidomys tridecemlineatus TaxID=43179 RepID=UPI001A9FCF21|nr:leucine-rich repeat and IQ domain-containing protein 1 isoform X3 [Ictidomys tridecemlineatus]